jgi:MFS transporter, SP family, arabinose:H+ symporter
MNLMLLVCSLVAALGGFLFGFDTVVISGAEQAIQSLWGLSATVHGLVISMTLWGTVFGSLTGGWPTERWGRKKTLIGIGLLYLIGSIWSGLAMGVYSLMFARFIGGIGIGVSTVAAPLYISEIAPPKLRGRLTGMFQFNIVFGILVAYASNALLANLGENAWRWMLGVAAFPSVLYTLFSLTLVESPRWLITHSGDCTAGFRVLQRINPKTNETDLHKLVDEIQASAHRDEVGTRFFTRRLQRPILLAFLIAFFNQLSGINAVLYFAPRIFEMTGLQSSSAMMQSVGIGLTNLVFTLVGLWLIDHLGRRTLLIIGSFGYIISLGLCSWAFHLQHFTIVPFCIFAFIASHAVGQGAVIWVFISEIFPNRHRAAGQALGSSTHWIFAALLTLFFPIMTERMAPGSIFAFFCFMMFLQLLWVRFMVHETKGVPLEKMLQELGIESSK